MLFHSLNTLINGKGKYVFSKVPFPDNYFFSINTTTTTTIIIIIVTVTIITLKYI